MTVDEPRPACAVVCLDCSPRHRWPQPFPTTDAADRWKAQHTRQYGHNNFETVEANDE